MTINLMIRRFDPTSKSSPYIDKFQIDISPDEKWTAMDLLDYVLQNLDGSLAYYRHSVCRRGICMRCVAKINGRVQRLCEYIVTSEVDILLEPTLEKAVVKDLVTKKDSFRH